MPTVGLNAVRRALLASAVTAGMLGLAGTAGAAELVGLITKTNNNPFFVKESANPMDKTSDFHLKEGSPASGSLGYWSRKA